MNLSQRLALSFVAGCALSSTVVHAQEVDSPVPVPEPQADAPAQDGEPVNAPDTVAVPVAPERKVVLGDPLSDQVSAPDLQRALIELAQRNPNWIEIVELGRSKNDRPVLLANCRRP